MRCLTEEQLEAVRFVTELEKKYPTLSFRAAVDEARKHETPPDR